MGARAARACRLRGADARRLLQLGEGGFGQVRQGAHQITGEPVALKFLSKKRMGSTRAAQRVVRCWQPRLLLPLSASLTAVATLLVCPQVTEIQCLVELNHPHVIKLLSVVNDTEHMVLVLEFAPHGDLRDYIGRQKEHRLEEAEALVMFKQILSATACVAAPRAAARRSVRPR